MSSRTEPSTTATAVSDSATETDLLVWERHGLAQEPERIPLIAAAFAAAVTVWWLVLRQPLTLPVPLLCLTLALNDFLFPARFRLTDRGAHSDCGLSRLFIAWSDVKRATHGVDGVYLSPFTRPSPLEAFRGIRLRFTNNADPVLQMVRERWLGATATTVQEAD